MDEPTDSTAGSGGDSSIRWSSSAAPEERWPSLPDDLLNIIYLRLVAGDLADRASFAAVCTSWHAVASTHQPRRVLPWLIIDPSSRDKAKHLCCLQAGAVLPRFMLLPRKATGGRFVGGHQGGWVVSWERDRLRIVNLVSGYERTLTAKQHKIIARQCYDNRFVPRKVIISSPPTSSGCILAAITNSSELVIFALGHRQRCAWTPQIFHGVSVKDIAFCNGHLYCMMCTKGIVKLEASLDEWGVLVFTPHWLYMQSKMVIENQYWSAHGDPNSHAVYILELRAKLVVATRRTWGPRSWSCNMSGPFFSVFELVVDDTEGTMPHRMYKWEELTSLGDYALFLSPMCAKAIHVSTGERDGLRRNHIYYSHHTSYKHKESVPHKAKEFWTSSNNKGCCVYYKEGESVDNGVEGITSVGYYVYVSFSGDRDPPMWMFPPDL